jgi:methylglutaconyl-CoA hydratase
MGGPSEEEALQQYGINLAPNHVTGYFFTEGLAEVSEVTPQPWESSLLQQMGPDTVAMCKSADGWNNEDFLFEIRDGIAYCTLNRPAANNALNEGIIAGLHDAGRILRGRPDIRIAVLTANGRMFCAGGDPKTFRKDEAKEEDEAPSGKDILGAAQSMNATTPGPFARDMLEWASLPQFTICCMNGSAMGNGVGLICNCDMVVAVKTAHVTLSDVKLGIIPADVSPYVIRTCGVAHAKALFATAENANMQKALEAGLVQRVVSDSSEFPTVIKEMATKIQAAAPGAMAVTKKTTLECLHQPMTEKMMAFLASEYARVRKGDECETGMKSLSAKKKPTWVEKKIQVKEGM